MPLVRSRLLLSATVTQLSTPLNDRAWPNRPTAQVAPERVPLLLEPEASAVVVPLPSLTPSASTRPPVAPLATVTVTGADVVELPAASVALAVNEWLPLATVVVFQENE